MVNARDGIENKHARAENRKPDYSWNDSLFRRAMTRPKDQNDQGDYRPDRADAVGYRVDKLFRRYAGRRLLNGRQFKRFGNLLSGHS